MRGLYYIHHDPDLPDTESFRRTVTDILALSNLKPYYGSQDAEQTEYLLKTCQNIFLTSFSIFELTRPNPSILIEIGIALGLDKPFILLQREGSQRLSILDRLLVLTYDDNQSLAAGLLEVNQDMLERHRLKRLMPEYCAGCHEACPGLTEGEDRSEPFLLLLNNTAPQHQALYQAYAEAFTTTKLKREILSQLVTAAGEPPLCKIRCSMQSAKFSLVDLSPPVDPDQHLALGLAIGMRVPWVLTVPQSASLPALLNGAQHFRYDDFTTLSQKLTHYIYKMFMPGSSSGQTAVLTSRLELPFWFQLEDWRARYSNQAKHSLEGVLHLTIKENNRVVEHRRLPLNTEMSIGRSPDSDVVVGSPLVSRQHASLQYRGQEVIVVDTNSSGGVFVDGRKIPAAEETVIFPGQSIRLGASYFTLTLWTSDESDGEAKYEMAQGGTLPPLGITINLGDGLVLDHQGNLIARLISQEMALLEVLVTRRGEVCTYEDIALAIYGKQNLAGLRMRIAAQVNGLRQKLESDRTRPEFIVTVPGKGYKLLTRAGKLSLL
jgi:pSer/pThr/pTyr-binding forkhead associated (FHA) protein